MKISQLLVIFLLLGVSVKAQHAHELGKCGNEGGEWQDMLTERLLHNKQHLAENPIQFRNTVYVPVRFHMVANSSGVGRVTHGRVLEQLCRLNQDFEPLDIQFYIKGINDNINNTTIYNAQFNATFQMNQLKDPTALNIWIVDVATPFQPTGNETGTILGYYNPARDWVVIRRNDVGAARTTLPHEIGHFFSLMHTHNGWDSQPWTADIGNPSPSTSPGGVPTERQDGSNCQTAGDFICDTPPDYNGFGFNGCNYNLAQDPTGVFINPDELLFMGYFLECNRENYYFSPTQQNLVRADYNSSSRNYLRNNAIIPNLTEITQTPTLVYPIGGETTPGYNQVTLEWSAVNGADFYLLEVDRVSTFTLNPIRVVVSGETSRTLTTLEPNRTYFWRVRPFNAYRTCALSTPVTTFKTNANIVSIRDITALNEWTISPNPIESSQNLTISLNTASAFEANFSLFNSSGILVKQLGNHHIGAGDTNLHINLEGLSPGVYLLSMNHQEGREIKRLIVSN
jgi:hypothetical protein